MVEAVPGDRDPLLWNAKLHKAVAHVPRRCNEMRHVVTDPAHVLKPLTCAIYGRVHTGSRCSQPLSRAADVARRRGRQPALKPTDGRCPEKADAPSASSGTETVMT